MICGADKARERRKCVWEVSELRLDLLPAAIVEWCKWHIPILESNQDSNKELGGESECKLPISIVTGS